jgi:hypothetical protein
MVVIKRLMGVAIRFGGEEHAGWLPANAATPPPTPVEGAIVDVEIGEVEVATYSSGSRAIRVIMEIHGTRPSRMPWNRHVPNSVSGLKNGALSGAAANPSNTSKTGPAISSSVLSKRDLFLGKWPPDLYTEPRKPGMLLAQR